MHVAYGFWHEARGAQGVLSAMYSTPEYTHEYTTTLSRTVELVLEGGGMVGGAVEEM